MPGGGRSSGRTESGCFRPGPSGRIFTRESPGRVPTAEELGHGGMGRVYKALHTKLDRVVALKVLTTARTQDPRAIARFEREMKAIGKLDHHHIVRAYDAREIDGTPVLVMEYVRGSTWKRPSAAWGLSNRRRRASWPARRHSDCNTSHEHGLVHRDIKPSNLMLTPEGEVKILDLGLRGSASIGCRATRRRGRPSPATER